MDLKKNPQVDIEQMKPMFRAIGFLLTFALVLVSFEWKLSESEHQNQVDIVTSNVEAEIVPVSIPITPPPPPVPQPTSVFEIINDQEEIEQELEAIDIEISEETEIQVLEEIGEKEEELEEERIFTIVEEQPYYPGGEKELFKYLSENIVYPLIAKDAGITGTVFITFIVDKDGSITSANVLRGIHESCDEEALRVIRAMPNWNPGKQRGKPVRVQYNLPVRFVLK